MDAKIAHLVDFLLVDNSIIKTKNNLKDEKYKDSFN